jgi:hypothetical protein
MSGEQRARGALQAMSRVSERRVASRSAWKKELLFWRRSEIGEQERKVLFARKEVKKSGQDCEVKLLPREVSNGTGRGVVITEGVGVVVVEPAESEVEDGEGEYVIEVEEETELMSTTATLDVLLSSCRFWILRGAAGGCR